ncbi:hypothetical protein JVT61DRAFT_4851 [Boletus reticuloceps]|uniref:Peptidase metallopeptidase domain-containing protein n=1 Tax=Boletus reticuloceps TaxID=495285 RepID=A0A8I2YNA1_9AGAM|nr:hypothetical protein JVT61DRAFT_4851 [Boletus reticuloceps]
MGSDVVCGPLPIVASLGVFVPPQITSDTTETQHFICQEPKEWPSHSIISYTFLDDTAQIHPWQVELVEDAINEYTRYANVNLIRTSEDADKSADIRISFKSESGAWSAIGTDALKITTGATMNLGFLSTTEPTDIKERTVLYNYILHEFGHAFGLIHEWETGDHYTGRNESNPQYKRALQQHADAYEEDTIMSNFMHQEAMDVDSIMRFFHRKYTDAHPAVELKGGLSENDKAWLTLMYPGKVNAVENNGVLRSLNVLGVPVAVSSRILLSSTVSEIRYQYHKGHSELWYKKDALASLALKNMTALKTDEITALPSKPHILKGKVTGITPLIDHNSEDDLYDTVAAALLDPQFSQVLANVVGQDEDNTSGVQHGVFSPGVGGFTRPWMSPGIISSGINPQASPDVQNFIGPLIAALGGMLGPLIFSGLPTGAAAGVYPQALPPNIEQGIWNIFGKMLSHPIFINTVKDVASEMLGAHGKKKVAEKEDEDEE